MATLEQYDKWIARARAHQDDEAVAALEAEARAELTGPASKMAQFGAGMQDIVTGIGQRLGLVSPEQAQEHLRTSEMATPGIGGKLLRGTGAAVPAIAATVLAPGVGTGIAGGALTGAGTGALMPTPENRLEEVATNIGLGGVTGGAAGFAAPYVGQILKRALGGTGSAISNLAGRFTGGGRQRAAETAFRGSIGEGEMPAVQTALSPGQMALTSPASGAPISTAAATRVPAMLQTERQLLEAGGELGQPLRDIGTRANVAQWEHLQKGLGADVPALKQAAQDTFERHMGNLALQKPFDRNLTLSGEIIDALNRTHNPRIKAELQGILEHFGDARKAGDIKSLHEFRMTALDDALSRLYQSDKKAAGLLRNRIEGFKETFDDEMEAALGNKNWSRFLADYGEAAQAREQGKAGEKLLGSLGTKQESVTGTPQLTQARQTLRTAAAEPTDKYGQPVYSPQGQQALTDVSREIEQQMLPYAPGVGPRGSATAQNITPGDKVLKRALEAQKREPTSLANTIMAEVFSTGMGAPGAGTAAMVSRGAIQSISDKQALDVARRLVELYANPEAAAQALAKANLPPGVSARIGAQLARVGAPATRALPATLAAMEAQRQ